MILLSLPPISSLFFSFFSPPSLFPLSPSLSPSSLSLPLLSFSQGYLRKNQFILAQVFSFKKQLHCLIVNCEILGQPGRFSHDVTGRENRNRYLHNYVSSIRTKHSKNSFYYRAQWNNLKTSLYLSLNPQSFKLFL